MGAGIFFLVKGKLPFIAKVNFYLKVKTWQATFMTHCTASCAVPIRPTKASQTTLSSFCSVSELASEFELLKSR